MPESMKLGVVTDNFHKDGQSGMLGGCSQVGFGPGLYHGQAQGVHRRGLKMLLRPLTIGTGILIAATATPDAQAAVYNIDSSISSLTLTVSRDETVLGGNWSGEMNVPAGPVLVQFGENGTYTVKLEEVTTTSTSALQGGFIATKESDNLAFDPSLTFVSASSPSSLAGNLSISPGDVTVAGSSILQQQLDYPGSLPIIPGNEAKVRDAINGNFGEVFNYGFFYDLPLNGQTPVGDYSASPGTQNVRLQFNGANADWSGPELSDGQRFFDTAELEQLMGVQGLLQFTEPGNDAFDFNMSNVFNTATVVQTGWVGAYTSGIDEDIIVMTFAYEYVVTSTINEFFDYKQCAENNTDVVSCFVEEFNVSSPTGTITTRFLVSGQILATGEGTFIAPPEVVPLPAALPLLMSALGGLGFFGWRRKRMAVA